jgi:hypothetical protein
MHVQVVIFRTPCAGVGGMMGGRRLPGGAAEREGIVHRFTQEVAMFEQALQASQAQREVPGGSLRPALYGCPNCGVQRMITSPEPIRCANCGALYTLSDLTLSPVSDAPTAAARMAG